MNEPFGEVTRLLEQLNRGDHDALERLLPLVYEELRALASSYLRQERIDHTLQPTALVHEAYLKLVDQHDARWESSGQFMAVAATAMRRILVDHSRHHQRIKRGGDRAREPWTDNLTACTAPGEDLVAVDDALRELEAIDARKVRVVELRFFVGLTVDETAGVLGTSPATVKRDWDYARMWLLREMSQDEPTDT